MKTLSTIEAAKGKLVYTLFSEEQNGSEVYGITVVSSIFGDEETATVRDMTSELPFAERLIAVLADNVVLPSTLKEVVEEYVTAAYTVK